MGSEMCIRDSSTHGPAPRSAPGSAPGQALGRELHAQRPPVLGPRAEPPRSCCVAPCARHWYAPLPFARTSPQETVDAKMQDMFKEDDDTKNIYFSKFMEVQSIVAKEAMRQTPSSVPSVRSLSFAKDPSKVLEFSGPL